MPSLEDATPLRRAVLTVALLNLGYFGVEFAVALAIGSVSLFADSIDFLEDASINLLILIGLSWSVARRALLGKVLAGILLVPGFATLWTAWDKFWLPVPPAPVPLTLAGTRRVDREPHLRADPRPLSRSLRQPSPAPRSSPRATTLSPMSPSSPPGFVTAATQSAWPDLVVGLGIAAINADAAREVYVAAQQERRAAIEPKP
jgi:Co/Zn/Cd efflux system component